MKRLIDIIIAPGDLANLTLDPEFQCAVIGNTTKSNKAFVFGDKTFKIQQVYHKPCDVPGYDERMAIEVHQVYFRFDGIQYSNGVDEFGDVIPGRGPIALQCRWYPVIKTTPKGVWIGTDYFPPRDGRKFILNSATKRFAWPTQKLALESFIMRKRRQISIYTHRIDSWHTQQRLAEAAHSVMEDTHVIDEYKTIKEYRKIDGLFQ